ncbi:MAG: bidirectional hydrogenase complex protein HoxU [Anaerolineae bacterium]|nr:bidirectional hydrogenase complex protein HoxU [Anaerolineae bacterium]
MSEFPRVNTVVLNGTPVTALENESVLDVCREHNTFIPTLCHWDGVSEAGNCRLCLVEVKGYSRPLPACVTRVAEGMEITTESEALTEYRRTILEMLLVEGNHICSVCVSNGHCELQRLAVKLGVDHVTMPYRYSRHPLDASHQFFLVDRNRCVLCTRCIRVCDEVEGMHNWDMMGRGIKAGVVSDLDMPWGTTDYCTKCGKCVQVCPTGALIQKGRAVGEMVKQREPVLHVAETR